ncbi:triose-phosphate isomerase [Desulfobacteraceae bacterium SEEP-SAG9]|nr:triose-phosphate isomerase [Desulfobacteraceae bacterium SEEP-SAG9]
MTPRKPLALANWKMAMTISASLAFIGEFRIAVSNLTEAVNVVICPPYTGLYAISQELTGSPVELGAQNLYAAPGIAHTGEISASLLADAGCKWIMLGHWETRRLRGETDTDVNTKMHAGLQAGLCPILMMGEAAKERGRVEKTLAKRLADLFADCEPEQAARLAICYEPEWTIGAEQPASSDVITAGCAFIRRWIEQAYGTDVAKQVRIIYGGSVTPEHAERLLISPDVDGLGASRMGRNPIAFAKIVRVIAAVKGLV